MPWLAASGSLSYTPEDPPSRDYFFQYSWILPEIFATSTNKRRHFYFGAHVKDHADELFSFRQTAREGRAVRVACHFGRVDAPEVTAPLAVYSVRDLLDRPSFLLMQHGSYQLVRADEQPLLDSGEVVLYRGVQTSDVFRFPQVGRQRLRLGAAPGVAEVRQDSAKGPWRFRFRTLTHRPATTPELSRSEFRSSASRTSAGLGN